MKRDEFFRWTGTMMWLSASLTLHWFINCDACLHTHNSLHRYGGWCVRWCGPQGRQINLINQISCLPPARDGVFIWGLIWTLSVFIPLILLFVKTLQRADWKYWSYIWNKMFPSDSFVRMNDEIINKWNKNWNIIRGCHFSVSAVKKKKKAALKIKCCINKCFSSNVWIYPRSIWATELFLGMKLFLSLLLFFPWKFHLYNNIERH